MNLATKPGAIKIPAYLLFKTALLFIENVPSAKTYISALFVLLLVLTTI